LKKIHARIRGVEAGKGRSKPYVKKEEICLNEENNTGNRKLEWVGAKAPDDWRGEKKRRRGALGDTGGGVSNSDEQCKLQGGVE